jgi:hypothetical protein
VRGDAPRRRTVERVSQGERGGGRRFRIARVVYKRRDCAYRMTDAEQRALRDRSEARDPCSLEILVPALWQSLGVRNGDFDREPLFGTQALGALADVFPLVKGNFDVVEPRDERVDVIEGK